MNKNNDIIRLRFLLQRYYEAVTSPEEEDLIMSLFSEIEAEDLPEDLMTDRKLFLSMKELLPSQTNMGIPEDLLGKINQEISESSRISTKRMKQKWKKPYIYVSNVAVACVVFVFGIHYLNMSIIPETPMIDNRAKNPVATLETSHSIASDPIETKIATEKLEKMPSTKPSTPQRIHAAAEKEVLPHEDDVYIEITDPEEAREIMLEIGRLLANNSKKANEATRMVENTIDEYKEFTKSIPK
ncbi:MAG: hypothetical protein K2K32_05160 [Muribaculaceae bacterium]|nr:hypothetical protein [Muribaculaceae bacterium]